jgi:hypothetical protein
LGFSFVRTWGTPDLLNLASPLELYPLAASLLWLSCNKPCLSRNEIEHLWRSVGKWRKSGHNRGAGQQQVQLLDLYRILKLVEVGAALQLSALRHTGSIRFDIVLE